MTFDDALEKCRREAQSERAKGSRFEELMKKFLQTYPEYREKFSDVWLWSDFPFKNDFGGRDVGIDIVAQTTDDEYWAVQCKFYADTTPISKSSVDTFLATSSKTFSGKNFSARLWISTSDNLTDNAEKTLQNQKPPVLRIGLEELRNAAVDWEKLDAGKFGEEAVSNFRAPLQHQLNAIAAAREYFKKNRRGKLIMACGTGKTYTSLKIVEEIYPRGKILFLVPGIALLSQTLHEWMTFAKEKFDCICVCSDETVTKQTKDEIADVHLPLPVTTDPENIAACMKKFRERMTVIFSTYQSLERVADAQKIFCDEFDLIICDEAHRTTGSSKDSATQFTAIHDENFILKTARIPPPLRRRDELPLDFVNDKRYIANVDDYHVKKSVLTTNDLKQNRFGASTRPCRSVALRD